MRSANAWAKLAGQSAAWVHWRGRMAYHSLRGGEGGCGKQSTSSHSWSGAAGWSGWRCRAASTFSGVRDPRPLAPLTGRWVALIAAGVGVTPVRALLDDLPAGADAVALFESLKRGAVAAGQRGDGARPGTRWAGWRGPGCTSRASVLCRARRTTPSRRPTPHTTDVRTANPAYGFRRGGRPTVSSPEPPWWQRRRCHRRDRALRPLQPIPAAGPRPPARTPHDGWRHRLLRCSWLRAPFHG
jgi:hypothetical protein